jgi:epoxyqueuosine reductase
MVRNACIAAGNSGLPELIPQLERLAEDEDPVVAEAAAWAVEQLAPPSRPQPHRSVLEPALNGP